MANTFIFFFLSPKKRTKPKSFLCVSVENCLKGPYIMTWCDLSYFTEILGPLDKKYKIYLDDQDSKFFWGEENISSNCYGDSNEFSLISVRGGVGDLLKNKMLSEGFWRLLGQAGSLCLYCCLKNWEAIHILRKRNTGRSYTASLFHFSIRFQEIFLALLHSDRCFIIFSPVCRQNFGDWPRSQRACWCCHSFF